MSSFNTTPWRGSSRQSSMWSYSCSALCHMLYCHGSANSIGKSTPWRRCGISATASKPTRAATTIEGLSGNRLPYSAVRCLAEGPRATVRLASFFRSTWTRVGGGIGLRLFSRNGLRGSCLRTASPQESRGPEQLPACKPVQPAKSTAERRRPPTACHRAAWPEGGPGRPPASWSPTNSCRNR